MAFHYKNDLSEVNEQFELVSGSYLKPLSASIWHFDSDLKNLIVSGIINFPHIDGIKIKLKHRKKEEIFGNTQGKDLEVRTYKMVFENDEREHHIGYLELYSNLDTLFKNLYRRLFITLFSNCIKTFFVAIFILYIIKKKVIKPIMKISDHITGMNTIGNFEKSLILERSDKDLDELDYVAKAINTQQQRLNHSYNQLSKLIYPHQIKHIQEGGTLKTSMPVGVETACIIAFDVIGSSQIKHEGFADLMDEFISRCRSMMMTDYGPTQLKSAGYMVKEMGDGFLCSVGYPFKQLGKFKATSAVELAENITKEFSIMVQDLETCSPIYCSIGIASGSVKAFFSKSGVVRHDLWGRPIVLAVRYEEIRKKLFSTLNLKKGNILIIQEDVFKSLPLNKREEFEIVDLKAYKIEVRDDNSATILAFKTIDPEECSFEKAS